MSLMTNRRPQPRPRPAMPDSPDAAAAVIVHTLIAAGYTGPQAVDIVVMRDRREREQVLAGWYDELARRLERAMPRAGAA